MFPTASTAQISLDARWAEPAPSAVDVLKTGFPAEAVRESERQEVVSEEKPLSDRIAEQEATGSQADQGEEAQDQPGSSADDAQDMRDHADAGPVSIRPVSGTEKSPVPLSTAERQAHSRRMIPNQGRIVGEGIQKTVLVDRAVKTMGSENAISSPDKSSQTSVGHSVVRNVPAAVLRAIEVEASLDAGVKEASLKRVSTIGSSSKGTAVRSLAEAESRTLQGMTALLAQRGGRMRVQLQPVQLGPVQIEVEVDGERVRAVIETSTRGAGKVLEASTSRLKTALEAQGYSLDRLEIRLQSQSTEEAADGGASEEDNPEGDADRTQADGRSSHHGKSSSEFINMDEDMSFAEFREQEQRT